MASQQSRSHSRTPSSSATQVAQYRTSSPSLVSSSRTPSPHVGSNGQRRKAQAIASSPTPPPGTSVERDVLVPKTTELHERLPRSREPKVPNAYYLQRKLSETVTIQEPLPAKHKPAALTIPQPPSNSHGFPEDPNRPISQRPFSQNYPWPYDPSSYYNMARSPTVSIHPKPKAYPVGWEENGGLSRPVSMAGIDLPIPLSPPPPPVPAIPEQYRNQADGHKGSVDVVSPKTHRDQGQSGIDRRPSGRKKRNYQQQAQQQSTATAPAPEQDPYEYIPQASSLESLEELWEITTHGKPLRSRPRQSVPGTPFAIPEGVYVLNMYSGAPINAKQSQQQTTNALYTPEHFAFGPNPANPFYTIQALPDALHPNNPTIYDPRHPETYFNDLLILRRNPVTNKDTSVLTMGLNPHAATSHRRRAALAASGQQRQISPSQGDELITLIYPKQAAMMAIDSSSIHVDERTGRIVGGDAQTMAREAVERAAETECCRLSWDFARDRYYLYHPGVGKGGEVYLVIIDDGNYTQSTEKGSAVEIASSGVGFDIPGGSKGSIKLINVDTSEAIVVLDFKSGLLFVNTVATRKVPSLYFVDVAVSTVLAVAVVEGRRIRDTHQILSMGLVESYPHLPAMAKLPNGKLAKHVAVNWDGSDLSADDKPVAKDKTADNNGGVLDLAGMIVNGVITLMAWIVGIFWAIGSAIGWIVTCGRGKKKGAGKDAEHGGRHVGGTGAYPRPQYRVRR